MRRYYPNLTSDDGPEGKQINKFWLNPPRVVNSADNGAGSSPAAAAGQSTPAPTAQTQLEKLLDQVKIKWMEFRASKWFWPVVILAVLYVFRKQLKFDF
jgi:hypothetical protein